MKPIAQALALILALSAHAAQVPVYWDTSTGSIVSDVTIDESDLDADITRDSEWDTTDKINTATTDDDFLTLAGGQTVTGAKTFSSSTNLFSGTFIVSAAGSLAIDGADYTDALRGGEAWSDTDSSLITPAAVNDRIESTALLDSEVSSLSGVKTLTVPDSTTISTFGATLTAAADEAAGRNTLGATAGVFPESLVAKSSRLNDNSAQIPSSKAVLDWVNLKKAAAAFQKMRHQRVALSGIGDSNWYQGSYGWRQAWWSALQSEFQVYGTGPVIPIFGTPEPLSTNVRSAGGLNSSALYDAMRGTLGDAVFYRGGRYRYNGIGPADRKVANKWDLVVNGDFPTELAFNWDYYYYQFKDPILSSAGIDRIEYDAGTGKVKYYLDTVVSGFIDGDGNARLDTDGTAVISGASNASNNGTFPADPVAFAMDSNAATDDTNATTGTGAVSGATITSESGSRPANDADRGSYVLRAESTDGGNMGVNFNAAVTNGKTYSVSFWVRASDGTVTQNGVRFVNTSFANRSNVINYTLTTGWQFVEGEMTVTDVDASHLYHQFTTSTSDWIEIDQLTVEEVDGYDDATLEYDGTESYLLVENGRADATDDEATTSATVTFRYRQAYDGALTLNPMVRKQSSTRYTTDNPQSAFGSTEGIQVLEGSAAADGTRTAVEFFDNYWFDTTTIANVPQDGPRANYAYEIEIPERLTGFSLTSPTFIGGQGWAGWRDMLLDSPDALSTYFTQLRRNLNGDKSAILLVHSSGNDINNDATLTPIGHNADTKSGFYDHTIDTCNEIRTAWQAAGGTDDTLHIMLIATQETSPSYESSNPEFATYRAAVKQAAAALPNASYVHLPDLVSYDAANFSDSIHMTQTGFDAHLTAIMAELTSAMDSIGDQ